MSNYLTTFIKETSAGNYKADIYQITGGFYVDYYNPTGSKIRTETYENSQIQLVESIVENWISSIKVLNG